MTNKEKLDIAVTNATSKFFSDAVPSSEVPSRKQTGEKQVFSFRGDKEKIKQWRAYASLIKMQHSPEEKFVVDDIWGKAIDEYIVKHPLDGAEMELFNKILNK